jgi:hypothetical protein
MLRGLFTITSFVFTAGYVLDEYLLAAIDGQWLVDANVDIHTEAGGGRAVYGD